MEFEAELEYQFPFQVEEDFPFELFQRDEEDEIRFPPPLSRRRRRLPLLSVSVSVSVSVSDDEDDTLSNVFEQSLDINMELKKCCAAYKYGLLGPFLRKFPFEDREHVPNSEYYDSEDSEEEAYRAFRRPNAHEVFLRFLKQVRESNGYDVDCCPPPIFCSPFMPIGPCIEKKVESYRNLVMGATHFAIEKINVETGKSYIFVKLDNVVDTTCALILLTFSVEEEEEESNSEVIALRAMVSIPYGTLNYKLEEWMFKPPPPTTEEKS